MKIENYFGKNNTYLYYIFYFAGVQVVCSGLRHLRYCEARSSPSQSSSLRGTKQSHLVFVIATSITVIATLVPPLRGTKQSQTLPYKPT